MHLGRVYTTPELEEVTYTYTATGGGCEVDSATGALTILGADIADTRSCEVTMSAIRSGYSEQTVNHTVTVAKGEQDITAPDDPYGGVSTLETGGTLGIVTPPTGGVGTLVYTIKSGGAACTIDGDGTVTGASATGDCVVQARWDGDENHNPSMDVDIATITIVGAASPDPVWGTSPYGGSAVVDAEVLPTNSTISNLGSGVGNPQYRSQTPATCSVGDSHRRGDGNHRRCGRLRCGGSLCGELFHRCQCLGGIPGHLHWQGSPHGIVR